MRQIIRDTMPGVGGYICKGWKPISLHRNDVGSSREFFNHTKDEGYSETDSFGRWVIEGQDDEPCNTGD